jgi:hypothetical protein
VQTISGLESEELIGLIYISEGRTDLKFYTHPLDQNHFTIIIPILVPNTSRSAQPPSHPTAEEWSLFSISLPSIVRAREEAYLDQSRSIHCSNRDGFRSFSINAESQARHSQNRDVPSRRLTLREDECEALPASPLYSTPDKTPQTSPARVRPRITGRRLAPRGFPPLQRTVPSRSMAQEPA